MKKMIQAALAEASGTLGRRATPEVLVQRLASASEVHAALDEVERETALLAKERGATWAQIGSAFGITGEAAIYRFTGGNERRRARGTSGSEEPLIGESIATAAKREGVSAATFRSRAEAGAYPQYRLVSTTYRGRKATRVENV